MDWIGRDLALAGKARGVVCPTEHTSVVAGAAETGLLAAAAAFAACAVNKPLFTVLSLALAQPCSPRQHCHKLALVLSLDLDADC